MTIRITKSGLIDLYAARRGRTVREATEDVNALLEEITDQLAAGRRVTITRFGVFDTVLSKGATRTPNGPLATPGKPSYKAKFKQGSRLKAAVAEIPVPAEDAA